MTFFPVIQPPNNFDHSEMYQSIGTFSFDPAISALPFAFRLGAVSSNEVLIPCRPRYTSVPTGLGYFSFHSVLLIWSTLPDSVLPHGFQSLSSLIPSLFRFLPYFCSSKHNWISGGVQVQSSLVSMNMYSFSNDFICRPPNDLEGEGEEHMPQGILPLLP